MTQKFRPWPIVRAVLGAVLLVAALLKAYAFAATAMPLDAPAVMRNSWFLLAVIPFEAAFGIWMLRGRDGSC